MKKRNNVAVYLLSKVFCPHKTQRAVVCSTQIVWCVNLPFGCIIKTISVEHWPLKYLKNRDIPPNTLNLL